MVRQLTEQGRERKQQLLDVAAELFAERGYGPTRIADICDAAGVAKGLFYWYFDTKAALFAELVRHMRLRLRRAQGHAMDPAADPVTRIRQGSEASIHFLAEHRAFFALVEVERTDERMAPVLHEGAGVYVDDVLRLVTEAQLAGQLPSDIDPTLAALGVLGTVSSFGQYLRSGRISAPIDDVAQFVGDWVVRGLAPVQATA